MVVFAHLVFVCVFFLFFVFLEGGQLLDFWGGEGGGQLRLRRGGGVY